MKNTETKAVFICILIVMIAILSFFFSLPNGYYATAFISTFVAISSFTITFLFASRARCMTKMLNGTDLIASWVYSEALTLQNIQEAKEENKGLWFMAMVVFSIIIIIVLLTVGLAAGFFWKGFLISLVIIAINILIIKVLLSKDEGIVKKQNTNLKLKENKKRYVYISSRGIYAHGLLHVWKGWGSKLKEIQYESSDNRLSFIYMYLRPYGFGRYTVTVRVPQDKDYIQQIKESVLMDKSIIHNL